MFLSVHFRCYAPLIDLLTILGLVEYFRKNRVALALLHLICFLPSAAIIGRTLVCPGYFYMFLFVTFALAAKGLTAILEHLKKGWEKNTSGWRFFSVGVALAYLRGEEGTMLAMLVYLFWLV